ncbi:MAG: RNA-binding protein [Thermoplasmata archaeon]|uniref:RNA-binding protein n=1 Tax=Candidatus Sysuiplasma superficiale TaxID=2823368 RepID=A0A8J7YJU9_9ARCH|nr:RNA-binding protein [Candidatus Sysuiplasma superficiale]MBX8643728.1 RNA-binding protein [Candidatus Sysuiplasma superficiale]MCL4347373.1 RNA-binding protein [Candidatus Thermoplasmatota archaeon]MCL5437280.1 RNA-binding protein [Candidatus Thermoplasmatota archaeon]
MTASFRIRRRHRLRQKDVASLASDLDGKLGTRTFGDGDPVEVAEVYGLEQNVYILNSEIVAVEIQGEPFLSLPGLLRYGATKRFITVDSGAVKFVVNGADIMGPGVVGGDAAVESGMVIWVREEKYGRPLAIGRSTVSGASFGRKEKGRYAESIYHVGDRLWKLNEELSAK